MPMPQELWTLVDLEDLLRQEEWRAADTVTQALLLTGVNRQTEGWLAPTAIAYMPCQLLHQIDHAWVKASGGQFGFSVQHNLYHSFYQANARNFAGRWGGYCLICPPLPSSSFITSSLLASMLPEVTYRPFGTGNYPGSSRGKWGASAPDGGGASRISPSWRP
jgi:hypothetical protein